MPDGQGPARPHARLRPLPAPRRGLPARLIRRHPGERIALVSHGGVLDCLYRHANAMTLTEPRQHELRNASINRLSSDGHQLTVLQWGDVAHLDLLVLDEVDRRVP